ncbi:MAG: hypothetical protein ACRYGR_07330 [Janthinobacterium lividum]
MNKGIIIIGTSGSGKTWTGKTLSKLCNIPIFHMDQIWWEPGNFNRVRSVQNIEKDMENIVCQKEWILEGVFGMIAEKAAPFATHLLWLNLTWHDCRTNIMARGPQFSQPSTIEEQNIALENLIEWASTHYSRDEKNSEKFFKDIFNEFSHEKICIYNRDQVKEYLQIFTKNK